MTVHLGDGCMPGRQPSQIDYRYRQQQTKHQSEKPAGLFLPKLQALTELYFAPVTFLYGGNGSGKTTLLNLIAERLRIKRGTYFNRSNFFADFVAQCDYEAPRNTSASSFLVQLCFCFNIKKAKGGRRDKPKAIQYPG